jgi:hypothetical protein
MRLLLFLVLCLLATSAFAQTAGVPVYQEGRGARGQAELMEKAKALLEAKALTPYAALAEHMKRATCELTLPPAGSTPLSGRERWQRARAAHLRVGFYYLCTKCDKWHLDLAGGYAITADGAVATCAHVIAEPERMKEGYLIAATDDDVVFPVTEILAVNAGTDSAILRVKADKLAPLPLGTDVSPGDPVWCFSDPSTKRGYYSEGIVSRFVQRPFLRKREQAALPPGAPVPRPVWLETTLDWAPGSSGSALIDAHGNCVAHVSEIQAVLEDPLPRARSKAKDNATPPAPGTYIVFHQAIAAAEVKSLVRPK